MRIPVCLAGVKLVSSKETTVILPNLAIPGAHRERPVAHKRIIKFITLEVVSGRIVDVACSCNISDVE